MNKTLITQLLRSLQFLLSLSLIAALTSISSAQKADKPPVKIFLMVGQSNMQGYGHVEPGKKPAANTLRHIVENDPKKEFQFLVNKDGSWKERSDVWIHLEYSPGDEKHSGLTPNFGARNGYIGPELGFGNKMGDAHDGQVLIIKACWGGKSLGHNFLPPSIGKYPEPTRIKDPGYYYHRTLKIVKNVTENIKTYFPDYQGQGIEFAGLCYHQGWNDQYGGLDEKYEKHMVAFINDIRSKEYGLGVPDLPVVIATSGMITKNSLIKTAQKSMADTVKYPQFKGNLAVVDTSHPYGAEKLQFMFDAKDSPRKQDFHWNGNARTHLNIGFAMAEEMPKLNKPATPSRLAAYGTPEGVQLTWQNGAELPKSVKLLRNGKSVGAELSVSQTVFLDKTALPGANEYELILEMPTSQTHKLTVTSDTSVPVLKAFRSVDGVTLTWGAKGNYEGFKLSRDGKVVEDNLSADARIYQDKQSPKSGLVHYSIQPTTGKVTPARVSTNLGPVDPGTALIYEPFDYPADPEKPLSLLGKKGAFGTKGGYYPLKETKPSQSPQVLAKGLEFGLLPVTGNRGALAQHGPGCGIELDGSLARNGLLKDGATMWISYVVSLSKQGRSVVSLQSHDLKEGIGFRSSGLELQTAVVTNGKLTDTRVGVHPRNTAVLIVGKIVWGKDGENDSFNQMVLGPDLKPQKFGRPFKKHPFNIDQTKLNRLVLFSGGEGASFDEIRVGATYESVIGGGTQPKAE